MNRKPARLHLYSGKRAASSRKKILKLLKADEAAHIDEIVELLELDLSSSEIFAALFELELAGKVKQDAGEEFCEELLAPSFWLLAPWRTLRVWKTSKTCVYGKRLTR
jgi:DprA/Smf-like nucleotide binding protein involved in DNA uptake